MRDRGKRTFVGSSLLPGCELLLNEVGDQLFSLNCGQFNRTFDLTVHQDLHLELIRQGCEKRVAPWAEQLLNRLIILKPLLKLLLGLQSLDGLEKLVNLNDQVVKGGDVGEQTFRDNDAAVVLASISSCANDVTDVVDDILERFVTILSFLRDDHHVRRGS